MGLATSTSPASGLTKSSVAVAGSGARIRLADNASLLDFHSGGLGHGAEHVVAAVAAQMGVNPLSTRHFLSLPLARLTARLARICPGSLEVSYLCNSGTEAVEGALKLAYGFHRDRSGFVALDGGYHGSSLGALSVCGLEPMRQPFRRLLLRTAFAGPDQVVDLVDRGTAGVIVEPLPGGIGRPGVTPGWLRRLERRCRETGALLIADETRSGLGRTGTTFAAEHEGVVPDIVVLGGPLGGGVLPVAGYVARRDVNHRVYGRRDPTLHASATGGNPAACAAALAMLRMMEEDDLPGAARAKGERLRAGLDELAHCHRGFVASVGGLGLLAWVDCHSEADARAVAQAAFELGLVVRDPRAGAGSTEVGLLPPLLIEDGEVGDALEILDEAISSVAPDGTTR